MSIAWTGRVMMVRADWSDDTGSTVTFKLPMNNDAEDKRNPFYQYTKRRKGKAGTRFMMACHTASEGVRHALYEDEAMLAGWNDSQQSGHTVKLWLCNDGMGHPFEGVDRREPLIISLVELDDDQKIIDQKVRERVERQGTRPSERPSYAAAMLCKNEDFWEWLRVTEGVAIKNEEEARLGMLYILGLNSRSVLDKIPLQEKRFHEMIRIPFTKWTDTSAFRLSGLI